ncbi:TPA: ankyrin repeat domain-containing protein [Escherichia coli]|nr:ankyrin repeat domain-containing protein [Escherichia coli]
MPKKKKGTLPKNFDELLKADDLDAIKAVFVACDVNARGGYSKGAPLAFSELPDEMVKWLVDQGADIEAVDNYGRTPLHSRAGHWKERTRVLLELGANVNSCDRNGNTPLHCAAEAGRVQTVRILLEYGARVDAPNSSNLTPLELALQQCCNSKIEEITEVAELLLSAQRKPTGLRSRVSFFLKGSTITDDVISPKIQRLVQRIGTDFEFHRDSFNPESLDATSAALDKLYALFSVPPIPRRNMHDGTSSIVAKAVRWQEQHQELWEKLVPSSGAAYTVQGEVIRISGRIANELDGNGGVNWDAEYKKMADALLVHFGSGNPLPHPEIKEAGTVISEIKRKSGDCRRLCELAVEWVALNPEPVLLSAPQYSR